VPDDVEIPPFELPEPAVLAASTVPTLGQADAPITIVEFSDYQSPFCNRHVSETMPTLMAEMIETGRVRYEFKDFPLDNIHPEARSAAEAARCAADQQKFWEYHDVLYAAGNDVSDPTLLAHAAKVGLDSAAFGACLAAGKHKAGIEKDIAEAAKLGLQSTPAFFVNGRLVSGAQPLEAFAELIDEELGGK